MIAISMGVAPFTYDPFTYRPFYLPVVGKRVGLSEIVFWLSVLSEFDFRVVRIEDFAFWANLPWFVKK